MHHRIVGVLIRKEQIQAGVLLGKTAQQVRFDPDAKPQMPFVLRTVDDMVFKHSAKHHVTLADHGRPVVLLIADFPFSQIEQDLVIVVVMIVIRLVFSLGVQKCVKLIFRNHQR